MKTAIGAQIPFETTGELPIDRGIVHQVHTLAENGVETFESCDGARGHVFAEPTVRFHGGPAEGLRAVAVAITFGLEVVDLRRYWSVIDGELTGPHWELTFRP